MVGSLIFDKYTNEHGVSSWLSHVEEEVEVALEGVAIVSCIRKDADSLFVNV